MTRICYNIIAGALAIVSLLLANVFAHVSNYQGYTQSQFNNISSSDIFNLGANQCDDTLNTTIYSGDYGVFVATIKNNDPRYNMYVHNYKIVTEGNYITSNPSINGSNNGVLIFNQPFLTATNRNRRVYPNEKIRHLTTAEEVGGSSYFQFNNWAFGVPITLFSAGINSSQQNSTFRNANYRAVGYPSTPTFLPNTDYKYRILTLVDFDDNVTDTNKKSENYVVMVCHNIVVRRCGDGIVEQGREVCDDGANNGQVAKCNATCDGYVQAPKPVCKNISITPLPTIIDQPLTINCNADNASYYNLAITNSSGTQFSSTMSRAIFTPTKPGSYTVSCEVTDANRLNPSICPSQTFIVPDDKPQCLQLSVSPNPAETGQSVSITCRGNTNANSYDIRIRNSAGSLVSEFNGQLGLPNYTTNVSFTPTTQDNFTISCAVGRNNDNINFCNNQILSTIQKANISIDKKQNIGNGFTDNIVSVISGQNITYQIIANNTGKASYEDVFIQDIIPQGLVFVSGSIQSTGSPETITLENFLINNQSIIQSTVFDFLPQQQVIITITARVNQLLPGYYTNVVQIRDYWSDELIDTDQVQAVGQTNILTLNKRIINPKSFYQSGDTISYSIEFSNVGEIATINTLLTDTLPTSVTYQTGSIQINKQNQSISQSVTTVNNQTIVSFGPFTFNTGQTASVIITGIVNTNNLTTNTTNIATLSADNHPTLVDTATFYGGAIPTIDKKQAIGNTALTDNTLNGQNNDIVTYQIVIRNNGSTTTTAAILTDTLPQGLEYITGSLSVPATFAISSGINTILTYSNITLQANQSATLTITARIVTNTQTSLTNIATLQFFNPYSVVSDQVVLNITPGLCRTLESLDGTVVLIDQNDDEGEATFRCTSEGNQVANITIDCGNGDRRSALDDELTYTCSYDDRDIGDRFIVQCTVNNTTNPQCIQNIVVDEPFIGYCGDGIRQGYEQCDITDSRYADGKNGGDFIIDRWLDDGYTSASSRYEGATCRNCSIRSDDFVYSPPACRGVNTSISVSKGEILPFRWHMQIDESKLTSGNTCKEPDSVPAATMKCDFAIYKNQFDSPVYERTTDCAQDNWNDVYFDFFRANFPDTRDAFGKYNYPISNNIQELGEYKLVLEAVRYEYCDMEEEFIRKPSILERVCEVNFTITQPYFMQRGAFGEIRQASNIDLSKFTTLQNESIVTRTDLQNVTVQSTASYNGGTQLNSTINNTVSKYTKLAAKVNDNSLNSLFQAGGQVTISKVPGQQIYIFQSNGASSITLKELNSFTKPFTMIIQDMDLIIEGSVTQSHGLFIVQGGKISFTESASTKCRGRQIVNGFFITNEGFGVEQAGITINNKLGTTRCNEGGLTIRGGLIGNGLENLVLQRRAHLNHRFRVNNPSPTAIQTERRNEIFNGAALLIEYNPSIRQANPPGLSDFTQIINIYKN